MVSLIKQGFEKLGVQLALKKNLWYLQPYQLMKKMVTKDHPVILDVGACDGCTSRTFKELFPQSRIYAFEPFPESFRLLQQTADALANVTAHAVALSNFKGQQPFFVNRSKATNSLLPACATNSFMDDHVVFENAIDVCTTTLDQFAADHQVGVIDILKMDVQGGELLVLEGARELLAAKKIKYIYSEIWFIEGYRGQPLYHDIAAFLHPFGYLPFGVYHVHYRHDGHQLWGDALFYLKEDE